MKCIGMSIMAGIAVFSTCSAAQAQERFPVKPLRMVVGFSAGSEVDIIARLIGQKMTENWGQRVVVDPRPGAGGTLAAAIVASARPDGYTLLFISGALAAAPALYPKLPYDTLRDLSAVSQATSLPIVVVAAPTQGAKSVRELIALAKQKPGAINFGTTGVGSGTHLAAEMFRLAADIKVSIITYKGVPETVIAAITGRVHYTFAPIGNTIQFINEKRLVALAVSTANRSPALPEVPTVAEAAIPGFEFDHWYGLFAPSSTPGAIVNKLSQEVSRIMRLPDIRDQLASRGAVPKGSSPEEFTRFMENEVQKLGRVIRAGGIKLQ